MSYLYQAALADDTHIRQRVTACAATEGIPEPQFWAQQRMWLFSAEPGWVAAYSAAIEEGANNPGAVESAVTDRMILAAVRKLNSPSE